MSLRIRQIVVAAANLDETLAQFRQVFDLEVAYRDPEVAKFGLANAILVIGDQFLEIVSPRVNDTAVNRHLDRHGDSAYMLILQTDDLDRHRARLETEKVRIIYEGERPGIRALHLHPKDVGAAIVSLDEAKPADAWPWAGNTWQQYAKGKARKVTGVIIGAQDPRAMARRWSAVLGTEAPALHNSRQRIAINAGELLFATNYNDCITEFTITVTDPAATIARAEALGLKRQDQSVLICGTRFRLLPAALS